MSVISVIIPVYNSEKTIGRCLESILDTTYTDYEIILIDDGSVDKSIDIINIYMTQNDKIRLIRQENSGPSVARNKGLAVAKGEIITFVDSDDYVEQNYLDILVGTFSENHADVVFFEYSRVDYDGKIVFKSKLPEYSDDYYKNLISLSECDMFGYTWVKAFKREVIGDIRFNENMNLFEDEVLTCEVLQEPIKLFFLREGIYNYVCSEGSLVGRTHIDYHKKCELVYCSWKKLLSNYETAIGFEFLRNKSNILMNACKFYGLERNVKLVHFFYELSQLSLCKDSSVNDKFINALKHGNWIYVFVFYAVYCLGGRSNK